MNDSPLIVVVEWLYVGEMGRGRRFFFRGGVGWGRAGAGVGGRLRQKFGAEG